MEIARGTGLSTCEHGRCFPPYNNVTDVLVKLSGRVRFQGTLLPQALNLSESSHLTRVSISSVEAFKLVQSDVVKTHVSSKLKRKVQAYKRLAGRLAEDGHLVELADLAAMLIDAGLHHLNFISALSVKHVHSATFAALSNGQVASFLSFVQKMHSAGFNVPTFVGTSAMKCLADMCNGLLKRGEPVMCISLLQPLTECGIPLRRLVNPKRVIVCCASVQNVEAAFRFAALLPGVNLHFNHMIQLFGTQGQLQDAFVIFTAMKESGIKPDMYTYRSLIDVCAHHEDPARATEVFKELLSTGETPNVYVYNSLMNVQAGNTYTVWKLYEDMKVTSGRKVEPDLATYNTMLKSCSVSKCVEKAKALYLNLEKDAATFGLKLDVFTYTTAIHVFGEAKMWDLALKVKEDMLASNVIPNVITWTALIGAFAQVGMVEKAFIVYDEMLASGCTPNAQTYNMLINACCEANQHDRAIKLFEEWKEFGKIKCHRESEVNESPGTQIARGLLDELSTDAARNDDHKRKHTESTAETGPCMPNLVTYNTLMKALSPEPVLVKEIMNSLTEAGFTPNRTSWSTLIDAYGTKGDLKEAINAFEEMKRSGVTPDLVTYTSMIKACATAKDSDQAFLFFRKLKDAGLRPNKVTYNTLFRAQRICRKVSEVQRALALYEEMRDAGYAPNDGILRVLLEQWAEGAFEGTEAEQWTSKSKNESPGHSDYTRLLFKRVAVHAQADGLDPNIIDLHDLSRGEARTAVLAVLRIIKERFSLGYPVETDLVIITSIENPGNSVVRDAVSHVLEHELGIPVTCGPTEVRRVRDSFRKLYTSEGERLVATVPGRVTDVNGDAIDAMHPEDMSRCDSEGKKPFDGLVARRPTNYGRLIVGKDALKTWLVKKRSKD